MHVVLHDDLGRLTLQRQRPWRTKHFAGHEGLTLI
jgi:hypothetical protein